MSDSSLSRRRLLSANTALCAAIAVCQELTSEPNADAATWIRSSRPRRVR